MEQSKERRHSIKENQDGDGKRKERKKARYNVDEDAWERADLERVRQRIKGKSAKEIRDEFIDLDDWR